jgi:hypothetical protein
MSGTRPGGENVTLKVTYSFANVFITKMITNTLIDSMQEEYMSTFGSYRIYLQGHSGMFTTNPCTNKVSAKFPNKLC